MSHLVGLYPVGADLCSSVKGTLVLKTFGFMYDYVHLMTVGFSARTPRPTSCDRPPPCLAVPAGLGVDPVVVEVFRLKILPTVDRSVPCRGRATRALCVTYLV